ncbi:hypothetical protein LCGC14_1029490 [marine sediment metagenome]|uniref:B12-binding domain-containing protein n=1 Tax=marine sediment metagenome TaxID=412755 RepID=A0A0F9MV13_9ZZZZ
MQEVNTEIIGISEKDGYFINKIIEAVCSLDFFSMKETIKEAVNAGVSTIDIIKKGVLEGLEESGEMGLILAAEALAEEMPNIDEEKRKKLDQERNYSGKVVVGTIKGDIHSLGKNILVSVMKSYGMDVMDLGVDVEPEKFLEISQLPDVKVIGISYLLSSAEPEIRKALALLKNGNQNNKVKVILGGAAVVKELGNELNADALAPDALKGVEIIDNWLRNQ